MRKVKDVTVPNTKNRDKGKVFRLTEMPASKAEAWAIHTMTLIASTGVNLPDNIIKYGWAGLAIVGLDALLKVDYHRARPLLDEMMECVQIIPDAARPIPHAVTDDDIEEVETRLWLRDQVFEIHSGFCVADAIRATLTSAENLMSSQFPTQTSQDQSEPA